jgi:hypothetical protein
MFEFEDLTVTGPPHETEYRLEEDHLNSDRYHEIARTTTQKVLTVNPRDVAKVRIRGEPDLLRKYVDAGVVELLMDAGATVTGKKMSAGPITFSTQQLQACLKGTPEIIEAVLSLHSDSLWHAHFLDEDGQGIAARYDGTMQHYWLPQQAYQHLLEDLDEDVANAMAT